MSYSLHTTTDTDWWRWSPVYCPGCVRCQESVTKQYIFPNSLYIYCTYGGYIKGWYWPVIWCCCCCCCCWASRSGSPALARPTSSYYYTNFVHQRSAFPGVNLSLLNTHFPVKTPRGYLVAGINCHWNIFWAGHSYPVIDLFLDLKLFGPSRTWQK